MYRWRNAGAVECSSSWLPSRSSRVRVRSARPGQPDRDRGDRPRGDPDRELPRRAGRRRCRRCRAQQEGRDQGSADPGQVLQHAVERERGHGVRPPGGLGRRDVRDGLPRDAVGPDHPDPPAGEHPDHRQPLGRQPDRLDEPDQLPDRGRLGEQLPGDPVRDEELGKKRFFIFYQDVPSAATNAKNVSGRRGSRGSRSSARRCCRVRRRTSRRTCRSCAMRTRTRSRSSTAQACRAA